jgi:hypothetical protein
MDDYFYYLNIELGQEDEEWKASLPEIKASMPEIEQGVLVTKVCYEASDNTRDSLVSYVFGDYTQIHFPLTDGTVIDLEQGEEALYIGIQFLSDVIEKNGERFLDINGELIRVSGVLDDITGKGEDSRIFIFGCDASEEIIRQLETNSVCVEYYCDETEQKEEFEQFVEWLSQNSDLNYCIVQEDSSYYDFYESDSSFVMIFVEKAVLPIIFCCICNCLLIIQVYIRQMKRNLYIRRMCGMSWLQMSCLIGSDYGIILIPSAVLIGIVRKQTVPIFLGSVILLFLFSALSAVMIRFMLNTKGRCL